MEKFDSILSELERRGHEVTRQWTTSEYTLDAVVSPDIAILKTPSFHSPKKVSKHFHEIKLARMKVDGWKVFEVPKGRMSEVQIKEFVDKIEAAKG